MKKTKTIATKILVPVFVLVFVFESATSLIGYFAYRKSNEASYSEENGEIVDTFQNYFDNFFVAIASNEYYIDKTIEIYNQNAPEKDYKDLTEDEKIAYYNLFYKDVGSHVADDGINYFSNFATIFYSNAKICNANAVTIGFIDKERNRMVDLFVFDGLAPDEDAWPLTGTYSSLYDSVSESMNNGQTSFDGRKNSRYSVPLLSNGRKVAGLTSGDVWVVLDQKMTVVNKSLYDFMIFFFTSIAITRVSLIVILYFVLRRVAVGPTRLLAHEAERYTDSLKKGQIENVFFKSKGRPDEITTLNDSFYFLDEELRNYIGKTEEALAIRERAKSDLALAAKIQLSALPKSFIHDKEISFFASMIPAKEVVGDLYGFNDLGNGRVFFFVGDVSGKGIPASLFMMQAKTLLQVYLENTSLLEATRKINNSLIESDSEGLFLTAFIGVFDQNTGVLHYINAGHEPVFVSDGEGEFSQLAEIADVPLAILPDYSFHLQSVTLKPGSRLFAYTDGVSEAMSKDGKLFGKDMIKKTLESLVGAGDEEIVLGMKEAIDKHAEGAEQYDDICMLSFTYLAGMELLLTKEDDLTLVPSFTDKRLEGHLSKNGLSAVDVILDELLSNVIFYSGKQDQPISLLLFYSPAHGAVGIIKDHGKPFDPLKEAPKRKEGQIGGYGITISKTLSTSIGYKRIASSNILIFTKKE